MGAIKSRIAESDLRLADLLEQEENTQRNTLEMVASESVQSRELLELGGCIFNNKTAVGLPGHQRLKGTDVADALERLTAERACRVFGAEHANVCTYSGSVANYCVYAACMNPGDRAVALDASAGSHQTHGGRNNISSKIYRFRYFGLHPETYLIDYEAAERLVWDYQPKLLVIGSGAYPRNIDFERFADLAHSVGAKLLVDIAHFTGLIAAGIGANPVPYADVVSISGTKTMCGPHTGILLCKQEMADALDAQIYPGYISSLHLQTIAAMAYALKRTETQEFRDLMHRIVKNAKALCLALQKRGFGILTGGTDCHMFWTDLRPLGADAASFADRLDSIGISVNTKGIPYDSSASPNGIRAGTIVLTQRGMNEDDMERVADIWYRVATCPNEETLQWAKEEVAALTAAFPLPECD